MHCSKWIFWILDLEVNKIRNWQKQFSPLIILTLSGVLRLLSVLELLRQLRLQRLFRLSARRKNVSFLKIEFKVGMGLKLYSTSWSYWHCWQGHENKTKIQNHKRRMIWQKISSSYHPFAWNVFASWSWCRHLTQKWLSVDANWRQWRTPSLIRRNNKNP